MTGSSLNLTAVYSYIEGNPPPARNLRNRRYYWLLRIVKFENRLLPPRGQIFASLFSSIGILKKNVKYFTKKSYTSIEVLF